MRRARFVDILLDMDKELVATSDVKADVGDIEMGKSGDEVNPQNDSVITEHKVPLKELAAHLGTDFDKGLTTDGEFIQMVVDILPPTEFPCCFLCEKDS